MRPIANDHPAPFLANPHKAAHNTSYPRSPGRARGGGRTGPVDWRLRAGGHFLDAVAATGPLLLGVGVAVTLASTLVLLFGARWLLGADWVTATGVLVGGQTQPALLAFAGERTGSEAPNDAYVAVMPAAMLAKIALAKWLLLAATR